MTRTEGGFAAPMAALAVALLALGLIMALPSSDGLAQEVRRAEARLKLERTAVTATSRVAFLLLTEPVGQSGLEIGGPRLAMDGSMVSGDLAVDRRSLLFDGRPYRFLADGADDVIVRIQDQGGLINIAEGNRPLLASLMQMCGASASQTGRAVDAMALARPHRRGADDAHMAAPADAQWQNHVHGALRRKLEAASTYSSSRTGLHLATAPPSVLMALYRGNTKAVASRLAKRTDANKTANMAIKYTQNEYKPTIVTSYQSIMSDTIIVTVESNSRKLTGGLPLYFNRTPLKANVGDYINAFTAEGAIIDAGRYTECYPHLGEVAEPFPDR